MERTILHLAIDSFPIEAERLRCPKLQGRPVALVPWDSPRPRVLVVSREARGAGIEPGTPAVVARRLCRDLVALPPDRDFYAGIGESIFDRLSPLSPLVEPGGGQGSSLGIESGRFFLDLTGLARTHPEARDHAARAGREVERAFGLHPALGVAANKLVSRVAAQVVAPEGDMLEVFPGSEIPFLAPLRVSLLPAARRPEAAPRLNLLNVRFVGDVQALSMSQLARVFGQSGTLLWRQAHGVDPSPVQPRETYPRVTAQETLSHETNDRRALGARVERLANEIGSGLRARREGARRIAVSVDYVDGREDRAERSLAHAAFRSRELRSEFTWLLGRAVRRRVRVRRIALFAWGGGSASEQLAIWEGCGTAHQEKPEALETALDRVRARFGSDALLPASWIFHGLTVRAPSRP